MNNIIKGREYEEYINSCLNKLPITKESYLWKDVPEQILYDAGLITNYNEYRLKRKTFKKNPFKENTLQDVGIDIVRVTRKDKIDFIQCNNYKHSLKVNLAGFWMIMTKYNEKDGYVYHSINQVSKKIIENNLIMSN